MCVLVLLLQPLLQTSQFTFYLAPRPAIKNVQLELKEGRRRSGREHSAGINAFAPKLWQQFESRFFAAKL